MKSYMSDILSKLEIVILMPNNCHRLNKCKKAPETILQIRKFQILRGKWAKCQTKAKKRAKDNFFQEIMNLSCSKLYMGWVVVGEGGGR